MFANLGHLSPQSVLCPSRPFTIFCQRSRVKFVRPWKFADTYGHKINHSRGVVIVTAPVGNGLDDVAAVVEGSGQVVDGLSGAVVAHAIVKLAKGGTGLLVEVVESRRDVRVAGLLVGVVGSVRDVHVAGSVRDGIDRDSSGEGNSAGSEDTEDGGETHGDEV